MHIQGQLSIGKDKTVLHRHYIRMVIIDHTDMHYIRAAPVNHTNMHNLCLFYNRLYLPVIRYFSIRSSHR